MRSHHVATGNKSSFKDVRANCFCASLLCPKFTRHVMHRAPALISKVNNSRANGHYYNFARFDDLGRSVTPIFLSMGHFLYRISTFYEKIWKIDRVIYRIKLIMWF